MFGLNRKAGIGVAASMITLITATAGTGLAHARPKSVVSASSASMHPSSISTQVLRYNDFEVTELLASGYGRAADDHPNLAKKFRTRSSAPSASDVAALLSSLKLIDSHYHTRVTAAVQSGNPESAQAGISAFADDLNKAAKRQEDKNGGLHPNGFYLQGEIVQSVFVATTAAVGAEVWAVIVLLWDFNNSSTRAFDKSALAADVAHGLN